MRGWSGGRGEGSEERSPFVPANSISVMSVRGANRTGVTH